MISTPSTRRQHDGVAVWSLTDRFSQHGHVIAEKGLGEELSGAPDTLVDFHTGVDDRRQDAAEVGVHVHAVVGSAILHQGAPVVLRLVGHEPQGVEVRRPDEDLCANPALSHLSANTWPCWPNRSVRDHTATPSC